MIAALMLLGTLPRIEHRTPGERRFARTWVAVLDLQLFMLAFAVIAALWFGERLPWISVLNMALICAQLVLLAWLLTAQRLAGGGAAPGEVPEQEDESHGPAQG